MLEGNLGDSRESKLTETAWEILKGHKEQLNLRIDPDSLFLYKIFSANNPHFADRFKETILKIVDKKKIYSPDADIGKAIKMELKGYSMREYNEKHGTSLSPKRIDEN